MGEKKRELSAPDRSHTALTGDAVNPAFLFAVAQSLFNLVHDEHGRAGSPYAPADFFNLATSVLNVAAFPHTGKPVRPLTLETRTWPRILPSMFEEAPGTLRQYIKRGPDPATLCASGQYSRMSEHTSVILRALTEGDGEVLQIEAWKGDTVQELSLRRTLHSHPPSDNNQIVYDFELRERRLGYSERIRRVLTHRGIGLLGLSRFLYSKTYSQLDNLPLLFPPM